MKKDLNQDKEDLALTSKLREMAFELGVNTFGVSDLNLLSDYETFPKDLLKSYSRGISVGLKIPDEALEKLPESRPIYAKHTTALNNRLDFIAYRLSIFLESSGYKALSIPASNVINDLDWRSHISHRAIARTAGIGWIGKSLNLVTKEYGPRLRLASILTDAPLETGAPLENNCGKCQRCIDYCIVKALKNNNFKDYPKEREISLDIDTCVSKLEEFSKDPDLGIMSCCGVCIQVCPFGRSKAKKTKN